MSKKKSFWSPDWSKAPRGTIGASFNQDGQAWFWSVKPEIRGSERRPWDKKWRGPTYGEGFTFAGEVGEHEKRALWQDSWLDMPPKGSKS